MLASGEFDRAREAQKNLRDGQRALNNKDAQTALTLAEKAEKLNPGFYQNASLQGRALLALDRGPEAAQALDLALKEHPAFLKEKQELEVLLHKAQNMK